MLTSQELVLLETLLTRARHSAGVDRAAIADPITPGDVVQLRPGTCAHWETSLLIVSKIREDGRFSGPILRPHRSGCRDAWYTYSEPQIARIGRVPFPEPGREIQRWGYCPPCPMFAAEPKPIHRETRGRKKKVG